MMRLPDRPRLHETLIRAALRLLDEEQGRFTLWLAVAAIAGDASYFGCRTQPPFWAGAALLALGAGLAAPRRWLLLRGAGLAIAWFGFGMASAQLATLRAAPLVALPRHATMVGGRVTAREALPAGTRLTLDHVTLDGAPLGPRRLRIAVHDRGLPPIWPGAVVTLRGMVLPPPPPAYPGGRDLQRDAWFDGLAGYGYALGAVTVTHPAPADVIADLRDRIAQRLQAELPGAPGAVAATLLTGLSAAIPPDDRAAFRDAGLSHLLAIAGLHIGIVMGIALFAARFLLLRSEYIALFWPVRQIAAVVALLAGLIYLELTGAHVPTLRSFIMATLVVLALLAGRRAISLRGWGLAVLAVIAVAPAQVTGASFQLSFAAVLALIAGYEALRGPLQKLRGDGGRGRRAMLYAATLILTSLFAGMASLPFIAYHFGRIQLYFVLANLLAVPLTALWVMPAGLAALALMPVGLDRLALVPMGWGIRGLLWIAHQVASWPDATLATPHLPLEALLLIAAGLALLCLWRSRIRLIGLLPMVAGGLVAALVPPPDLLIAPDSRLVGVRGAQALYLHEARGGDAYVQSVWEQFLGQRSQNLDHAPGAHCDPSGCRLGQGAHAIRLGDAQSPCDAAVMVSEAGGLPYCPGAVAIDRATTFRNGAVAVWFGSPPIVRTDRARRGQRPWVFLPPEQGRAAIHLPFAKIERP